MLGRFGGSLNQKVQDRKGSASFKVGRRGCLTCLHAMREYTIVDCVRAALAPVQVRTRSPMPARPPMVSGWAPRATASRVISLRPRVISAARPLQPKFRPSLMPHASARTFFSAPPSSTPAYALPPLGPHHIVSVAQFVTDFVRVLIFQMLPVPQSGTPISPKRLELYMSSSFLAPFKKYMVA